MSDQDTIQSADFENALRSDDPQRNASATESSSSSRSASLEPSQASTKPVLSLPPYNPREPTPRPPRPLRPESERDQPSHSPADTGRRAARETRIRSNGDRPPDRGDARLRIGIVGGKMAGKSYLFQGMVYRTQDGELSGALTYFLEKDAIELWSYASPGDQPLRVNLDEFLGSYESWTRLETTRREIQKWYRLRLGYRCGVFGTRRSALELELLDGSGEGFFEAPPSSENLEIWRHGFMDVGVMIFCLPLWVAFPRHDLTLEDWEQRDELLGDFQRVLGNFAKVREELDMRQPVRSILALTMADDGRSALDTLRQRWIEPYMEDPRPILRQLRKSAGTARYLNNAREISKAVREEFRASPEARVTKIVRQLDFGAGTPWIVPLSAIEGSQLERLGDRRDRSQAMDRLRPPVPVHVELPLLVALCEQTNALM